MIRFIISTVFGCLLSSSLIAQPKTDALLREILEKSNNEIVTKIIHEPDTFRLQIIYTQIDRDGNNVPTFKNYYFNFDNNLYFNPASTVKMPLAFLALEKFNRINKKGVNKYTAMQFDSTFAGQVKMFYDSSSENYLPSIAHFIKKAFLVSDNDAYNRMYQFIGQQAINQGLKDKGYTNTRIIRQFMGFSEAQNRNTNQIRFLSKSGKVIYTQAPAYNPQQFNFSRTINVGRGHLNSRDSLINKPINFTKANMVGLEDLQRMLQAVMFPESVPADSRFTLSPDDYAFLHRYLSQYPSETNYPKYDTSEYYDSYVKFFFRGDHRKMPANVRVFNKVGWAYGFLTDVSYIADFKNSVEFMLTATVYVNNDAILNDNRYEYKETGWPFMYEIGQLVYQYDLVRKRKYKPDLSKLKIVYEQRQEDDKRPSISNVDN
jgi:hypothetical protein